MRDGIPVVRPLRKSEYPVLFVSKSVEKNWRDLVATRRDKVVDAWETLTKFPCVTTEIHYELRNGIGSIVKSGIAYPLWQLKLDKRDGARIWYFMSDGKVYIEEVFTAHPNQTK